MDSPQSVVSPFKGSAVFAEPEKPKAMGVEVHSKEPCPNHNLEPSIGVLEVYIHQARDIHNICIYHKQDVYAKLCLTSDPEHTVSTQIINGGGKNPIFNEKLRLHVRTIESSLKCEIWMLSRVRNYLEDQLLGFALVPLSEVLMKKGKWENEFSLSSTDLSHSPAGFVQLSLSYAGALPEVLLVSAIEDPVVLVSELPESIPSEFDKIEFPDPKIVNENNIMVSEYFGIQCANLDSQSSESLVSSDTENQLGSESGTFEPNSCDTTEGSSSKSLIQETLSQVNGNEKEKREEVGDAESTASQGVPNHNFAKPVISVNIEPEQKVVQQDIVDMYMKSMQQFTESLAKMKLPLDSDCGNSSSENSSSDQKLQTPKSTGSRVFYGSRAFF
ncbi:hypothetical protein NMG60_11002138 [Bertholletia excelsa]